MPHGYGAKSEEKNSSLVLLHMWMRQGFGNEGIKVPKAYYDYWTNDGKILSVFDKFFGARVFF